MCSIMNLVAQPTCCKVVTNILLKMVRHMTWSKGLYKMNAQVIHTSYEYF